MKKSLFVFFLCLMSFASTNAQTSTSNTKTTVASPDSNVNFRLYQTNNLEIGHTNRCDNACAI